MKGDTLSDNELIAKFMGLPLTKQEVKFTGGFQTVPFLAWRYDTSWDWLMPVMEKISRIPTKETNEKLSEFCYTSLATLDIKDTHWGCRRIYQMVQPTIEIMKNETNLGWIRIGDDIVRYFQIESVDIKCRWLRTCRGTYLIPSNQRDRIMRELQLELSIFKQSFPFRIKKKKSLSRKIRIESREKPRNISPSPASQKINLT